MTHSRFNILFLCLLTGVADAATTLTSSFTITNSTIERFEFNSTDLSATYTDTGGGLFKITDNFTDANLANFLNYGNQQLGFERTNSLLTVTLTGQRLGHKFNVYAKYANSSFQSVNKSAAGILPDSTFNNGCIKVYPMVGEQARDIIFYEFQASSDVTKNCRGHTVDHTFPITTQPLKGIKRDFYIDIGRLQKQTDYLSAPPDTYKGTSVYQGEKIANRVGNGFIVRYTNNITILKKPYFESVSLPSGKNVFDVRTVASNIRGDVAIPFVIKGQFTAYDTINLNVTSGNNYRLQGSSGNQIPYSLNMTVGSQKTYPLVTDGTGTGAAIIKNLAPEGGTIQGRFNADFSVNKNTTVTGDYTDNLVAVFELTL